MWQRRPNLSSRSWRQQASQTEGHVVTLADTFHNTMTQAMEEAARRRSNPVFKEFLTKVEPSPYGGFRVRSYPADLFVDQLADGPISGPFSSVKHLIGA